MGYYTTYITVTFDEVAQRKSNGELNSNWANKGATMVEKVALVRALRETFAEDLGGMIDEDEAWTDEAHKERAVDTVIIEQPDPLSEQAKQSEETQIEETSLEEIPL